MNVPTPLVTLSWVLRGGSAHRLSTALLAKHGVEQRILHHLDERRVHLPVIELNQMVYHMLGFLRRQVEDIFAPLPNLVWPVFAKLLREPSRSRCYGRSQDRLGRLHDSQKVAWPTILCDPKFDLSRWVTSSRDLGQRRFSLASVNEEANSAQTIT